MQGSLRPPKNTRGHRFQGVVQHKHKSSQAWWLAWRTAGPVARPQGAVTGWGHFQLGPCVYSPPSPRALGAPGPMTRMFSLRGLALDQGRRKPCWDGTGGMGPLGAEAVRSGEPGAPAGCQSEAVRHRGHAPRGPIDTVEV
ncbi:hypothetical protein NDU88_000691 [Pleurodeles waltl]|uniref:Uncharacterized protein n=1 Tax=Pleurodeles waltl TaxID=8319 RepID=A0AAV7U660_PLEWA|nr:hypothetical protein NDU88_000691 [Pleurodeles waltl]